MLSEGKQLPRSGAGDPALLAKRRNYTFVDGMSENKHSSGTNPKAPQLNKVQHATALGDPELSNGFKKI
jgi:hypothetical protein